MQVINENYMGFAVMLLHLTDVCLYQLWFFVVLISHRYCRYTDAPWSQPFQHMCMMSNFAIKSPLFLSACHIS